MWQSIIYQLRQYYIAIGRPLHQTEISYLVDPYKVPILLIINNIS